MVHCGAAAAASTKIIDTRGRKEGRKERKEGRKEGRRGEDEQTQDDDARHMLRANVAKREENRVDNHKS
jgi:hypothetical protein